MLYARRELNKLIFTFDLLMRRLKIVQKILLRLADVVDKK
jgi:hypothetical protein